MEYSKAKEKNVRLYPKYKMLSWDLLFYYSIIFLFFTQVKGISGADVLLAESAYPLFKFILLIPLTILINRIGKRKSLIIANSFLALSSLTYILATNFTHILLGEFFCAVGFVIKGVCETNMLYDSIEKSEKRGSIFSKIDGKASSYYFFINAFSSIASGFLYVINGYLPIILCFVINLISVYLSTQFNEIDETENVKKITVKQEFKKLKYSMKSIFKSHRLKNLLMFGAIFSGILGVLITLRSSILIDIGVEEQYFGIIFGILGIISGISSKNQHRFHNKYRNKTLTILSMPVMVSCILIGIICATIPKGNAVIIVTIILFVIQYIMNGPFYILIRRYLNNFTTHTIRNDISSAYNLMESFARAGISFFASFLLRYTSTANVLTIVGAVFTVIIILLLDNMKKRVGLKPEQYNKKEIEFVELK